MDIHPNHRNIFLAYYSASQAEKDAGMAWYPQARALAETLRPDNVAMAAGVIAAMSQTTMWQDNVKRATAALMDGDVRHLTHVVTKVHRIMAGEAPLDVLSGEKVRSFYLNIMGESDSLESVTVDRHAIDIAVGRVLSNAERAKAIRGKAGYSKVAQMYIDCANSLGTLTGAELQAIVWVWWRRTHAKNHRANSKGV